MTDAALDAARENTIFPVETFGDTLIASPKGDKAGFGEADFRVESTRVAEALKAEGVKNLVVDFSLTNYVGGDVLEVLEDWAAAVRDRGGRAVACEASEDMKRGLAVSGRAGDHPEWAVYDTREEALDEVATEAPAQTARRLAPTVAAVLGVVAVLCLGAWLLTGRHTEERLYADLNGVWKDYAALRKQYPDPNEWADHTGPLVDRLDAQVIEMKRMDRDEVLAMPTLLEIASRRMRPILVAPRSPDARAAGVQAGLDYVRADLDDRDEGLISERLGEYRRTAARGAFAPPIPRNWDDPALARRGLPAPGEEDDPDAERRREADALRELGLDDGADDGDEDAADDDDDLKIDGAGVGTGAGSGPAGTVPDGAVPVARGSGTAESDAEDVDAGGPAARGGRDERRDEDDESPGPGNGGGTSLPAPVTGATSG